MIAKRRITSLRLNEAACRSSPLRLAPLNKTLGAVEDDAFEDGTYPGAVPDSQCRVFDPEEGVRNG